MRSLATGLLAAIAAAVPHHDAAAHVRGCATAACDARVQTKHRLRVVAPYRAWLTAVARCESGLRWHIATGNGFYGGLQFTLQSWAGVGGHGNPAAATPLEQMYRAVRLLHAQGRGAWPVCGR